VLNDIDEVRNETVPSGLVAVSQLGRARTESLPTAVFDLHSGGVCVDGIKANLNFRRIRSVLAQMPHIADLPRRLPQGDFAPIVLLPTRSPFENPSADAWLQYH
jgi:hypothetical protein